MHHRTLITEFSLLVANRVGFLGCLDSVWAEGEFFGLDVGPEALLLLAPCSDRVDGGRTLFVASRGEGCQFIIVVAVSWWVSGPSWRSVAVTRKLLVMKFNGRELVLAVVLFVGIHEAALRARAPRMNQAAFVRDGRVVGCRSREVCSGVDRRGGRGDVPRVLGSFGGNVWTDGSFKLRWISCEGVQG